MASSSKQSRLCESRKWGLSSEQTSSGGLEKGQPSGYTTDQTAVCGSEGKQSKSVSSGSPQNALAGSDGENSQSVYESYDQSDGQACRSRSPSAKRSDGQACHSPSPAVSRAPTEKPADVRARERHSFIPLSFPSIAHAASRDDLLKLRHELLRENVKLKLAALQRQIQTVLLHRLGAGQNGNGNHRDYLG